MASSRSTIHCSPDVVHTPQPVPYLCNAEGRNPYLHTSPEDYCQRRITHMGRKKEDPVNQMDGAQPYLMDQQVCALTLSILGMD